MGSTGNLITSSGGDELGKKITGLDIDNGKATNINLSRLLGGNFDMGKSYVQFTSTSENNQDIIFHFKLNDKNTLLYITAYNKQTKERASTEVLVKKPSLDNAIKRADTAKEKRDATKVKMMINESSKISQNALGQIIDRLLKEKGVK